jgi:predicted methyltransferase
MSKTKAPTFTALSKTVDAALADLEKVPTTPAAATSRDNARIHLQQAVRFLGVAATCETPYDE